MSDAVLYLLRSCQTQFYIYYDHVRRSFISATILSDAIPYLLRSCQGLLRSCQAQFYRWYDIARRRQFVCNNSLTFSLVPTEQNNRTVRRTFHLRSRKAQLCYDHVRRNCTLATIMSGAILYLLRSCQVQFYICYGHVRCNSILVTMSGVILYLLGSCETRFYTCYEHVGCNSVFVTIISGATLYLL